MQQINASALLHPIQRTRTALGFFFFMQGMAFGSWASRIPTIKSNLALGEAQLGSILLMLPLGQMTMLPFSGRIVAYLGSQKVLRISVLLYIAVLTQIGNSSSAWQLAFWLFMFGVSGNLCNIAVNTQGVQTEKLFERPIFTAFHGLWSLGGFTGAAVGALMIRLELIPFYHFLIIAGIVAASDFFNQGYLLPKQAITVPPTRFSFRKPDPVLMQLGLVAFCSMSVEGCMFDWTGIYFRDVIQVPERLVPAGYASFMIVMATGRFTGDTLALRFGRKRMVRLSGLLIFTGLLILVTLPFLVSGIFGCMLTGFGVSSIIPLTYSTAGKVEDVPNSIAIATVSGIGYFGFLLGPPIIGFVAEATGLQYSFLLMAVAGVAINLLVRKIGLFG